MELESKLRQFLADELEAPQEALAPDYPLLANHVIDSLGLLQIVSFLESEFDVQVEDEELVPDNFGSISAIVGLVDSKLGK